ncbi:O-antigen ligase family protein, partial [Chloroflexota bacterium]
MEKWSWRLDKIEKVAWATLFLTLPVTSFPFFPGGVGGKTLVRPLAIYPLLLLLVLVTVPRLFKQPLPRTFLPLFAFVVIALASSAVGFSAGLEPLRGVTITSRFIRNIITLGLGCAFFITIVLLTKDWDDLRFSLRWLYIGFSIALAWGTLQIVYVVKFIPRYFDLISQIQSLISTRKLFPTRISGLTYEPKWFAEQICFLLLPWLFGSVLTNRTVFRWRYKRITIEWFLLIWSFIIVVFTFSRTGIFLLVALSVLSIVLSRIFFRGRSVSSDTGSRKSKSRQRIAISVFAVSVLALSLFVMAQNPYVSRFWRYWTGDKPFNRTYLEYIGFQQRFVYWTTAIKTFEENPLFGVGLGNYSFYFDEMLPDQPWNRQPEIIRQITPVEGRARLITPKNLYARLLAETGLIGTITFTSYVFAIIGCVLYLGFSQAQEQKYWGLCGLLGVASFVIVIFSFDSFALPNMWIVFG